MATTKPDLTRVWANGAPQANVIDPDTTTPGKVLSGWQAEVPPFEHFNFLQKWFTQGLAHFNEQGVGVWDANTPYPVYGLAKGSDGQVYIAVSEQSGNDPVSDDGTNWSSDQANGISNYGTLSFLTISDVDNSNSINGSYSVKIGDVVSVEDYAQGNGSGRLFFKVVASGTGVVDGGKYIDLPTIGLQLQQNLKSPFDPKAWGAKHDFDPSTGLGTDSRPSVQSCIDYVQSVGGGEISMQVGNCYLGTDLKPGSNPNLGIQLLIGSIWSEGKDYVSNITFSGQNTNLFAGREGRMLTIGKSKHVNVFGINFYHYVGGTITGSRGISDNAIRVCDGSENIDIYENYMTNHLGWGIDITSDSENPASNNYMCNKVNIYSNTIKTRYGNGTRAYNTLAAPSDPQGTGGAWTIAIINGENINIHNNTLIGDVDLENNSAIQTFVNVNIHDNDFISGWVTPQSVIGNDYWHDEPTNPRGTPGAVELRQGCLFNGVGLDNDPVNVTFKDNEIENGEVLVYAKYRMAIIDNNFWRGRITVGYEQPLGTEQITDSPVVTGNRAVATPDPKGFISIAGLLTNEVIKDNWVKDIAAVDVISLDTTPGLRNVSNTGEYRGNRMGVSTNIAAGTTYRVNVKPFLAPTCTINMSVYLDGGIASAIYSVIAAGVGSTINTLVVAELAKDIAGGQISISAITRNTDGTFYFDVSTAFGTGRFSITSPESYAVIDVVEI